MVLGKSLTDKTGNRHAMANLLPLETSFSDATLHLGYRRAKMIAATPLGPKGTEFTGHEFHYCRITEGATDEDALFECEDSSGEFVGQLGMIEGRVAGSFVHLIDRVT